MQNIELSSKTQDTHKKDLNFNKTGIDKQMFYKFFHAFLPIFFPVRPEQIFIFTFVTPPFEILENLEGGNK